MESRQCSTQRRFLGEGKVEEVQELARRAEVKKRKLMDTAQELVDGGGHHAVDAEGMTGLELRPVDDGLVDELLGAGMIDLSSDYEEDRAEFQ